MTAGVWQFFVYRKPFAGAGQTIDVDTSDKGHVVVSGQLTVLGNITVRLPQALQSRSAIHLKRVTHCCCQFLLVNPHNGKYEQVASLRNSGTLLLDGCT